MPTYRIHDPGDHDILTSDVCSFAHCGEPVFCGAKCLDHWLEYERTGRIQAPSSPATFCSLAEKVFSYLIPGDTPTACWGWAGPRGARGMPRVFHEGSYLSANHAVWRLWHPGQVAPPRLRTLPSCSPPHCMHPDHIVWRARKRYQPVGGDRRYRLSPEAEQMIRELYHGRGISAAKLARFYDLSESYIYKLVNRPMR